MTSLYTLYLTTATHGQRTGHDGLPEHPSADDAQIEAGQHRIYVRVARRADSLLFNDVLRDLRLSTEHTVEHIRSRREESQWGLRKLI